LFITIGDGGTVNSIMLGSAPKASRATTITTYLDNCWSLKET
jgi:hypothetical protein